MNWDGIELEQALASKQMQEAFLFILTVFCKSFIIMGYNLGGESNTTSIHREGLPICPTICVGKGAAQPSQSLCWISLPVLGMD